MNPTAQVLREHLEARDLGAFLAAYAQVAAENHSAELTGVTQRVLPAVLREMLAAGKVASADIVQLWRLVRSGRLLVVDNDLIAGINDRLANAWAEVAGVEAAPPQPLLPLADELTGLRSRIRSSRREPVTDAQGFIPMHRVVVASAFTVGPTRISDTLGFKKNVCASSQEREFLKAIRQYFPNLWAYPNVPLRNLMDIDALAPRLSERLRQYAWAAQVDVLLCTDDEDPVAGFELDSVGHDTETTQERDRLKDQLFTLACVPLMRIRPDDTANVRAEDFYDLLCAESDVLDRLRPRRLRPRRNHDMLVPDEALARRSMARSAH